MGKKKISAGIIVYAVIIITSGLFLLSRTVGLSAERTVEERVTIIIVLLSWIASGIGLLLRKNVARIVALYMVAFIALANTAFATGLLRNQFPILWKLVAISALFINYYFFYFFTRPEVKEQFKQRGGFIMINKKFKIILPWTILFVWYLIQNIRRLLNIEVTRASFSAENANVGLAIWIFGAIFLFYVAFTRDKAAKIISEKISKYSFEDAKFMINSMLVYISLLAVVNIFTILYLLKG